MGYDATNILQEGTRTTDVEEFLGLLGFKRIGPVRLGDLRAVKFWHYDERNYERFQDLSAVTYTQDKLVHVNTRTPISRNKADCDLHNNTLRQLRKRFGGHFISDYGRNRYFPWDGTSLEGAEAGCYLAYWRFKNHIFTVHLYKHNREFKTKPTGIPEMGMFDPMTISNNFLVPFLVSVVEDYFKSTFKALLRFSENKASILRGHRIPADELLGEDSSQIPVEDALVRFMAFQNLPKITKYFGDVNSRIDIAGCLRKSYRRRKCSLYESMSCLIEARHAFIHRAEFDVCLNEANMDKLIADVQAAIKRVYEHLIQVHAWHANDQD